MKDVHQASADRLLVDALNHILKFSEELESIQDQLPPSGELFHYTFLQGLKQPAWH